MVNRIKIGSYKIRYNKERKLPHEPTIIMDLSNFFGQDIGTVYFYRDEKCCVPGSLDGISSKLPGHCVHLHESKIDSLIEMIKGKEYCYLDTDSDTIIPPDSVGVPPPRIGDEKVYHPKNSLD